MTQFEIDCARVEEWDRLFFHFFSPDKIQRFSSGKWQQLRIRDDEPGLTDVSGGIVSALTRSDTHRNRMSIGVYNSNGQPVGASIQFRGPDDVGELGDAMANVQLTRSAIRDGRSAYYLGIDASIYGHFIVETFCRAWAWEQNKCQVAIIQRSPIPDFARALLELVPDLAERTETLQQPTQFEHVIVPAPGFVMGREAYVRFKRFCENIVEKILPKHVPSTDQPLYLSRAGLPQPAKRALVGELRLERFLEREGFRVVRPEILSVSEQIGLFNKHKWIVGPNGSACHTRLFSRIPANMIVLTSEQVKPSFILGDRLCQGETHYANLFYVPDLGSDIPRDEAQPVMLAEERLLALLKSMGLIRPGAAFDQPAPDAHTYKTEWILFARERRKNRFRNAIEKLSSERTFRAGEIS